MYNNVLLKKSFKASGVIAPNTAVVLDATGVIASPATTYTSNVIGVTDNLGITAAEATAGATIDVNMIGIAELKLGGTVTVGTVVFSDASGFGVATAYSTAAQTMRPIGQALASGVSGDIIPVLLSNGVVI